MKSKAWCKKRDVKRYYNSIASSYNELYSTEQKSKFRAALTHVRIEGNNVLDLGCGTGLLFSHIKAGSLLVGVDLSSVMLKYATKNIRATPHCHVICADVDFLPFREGIFDTVFAITLFQNVASQIQTLQEVVRVLNFDASLVLTMLKSFFTPTQVLNLLHSANLRLINWISQDIPEYMAICKKVTFYSKKTR